MIITGNQNNITTATANASEGGNPGYFSPVDSSFSLIQIGWTVVDHPELGTVTNVIYVPEAYGQVYTSSGSFMYGTSYTFIGEGGSGVTITGGATITGI